MKDTNFNSNLFSLLESSRKQIESMTNNSKSNQSVNPSKISNSNLTNNKDASLPQQTKRFKVQSTPKEKFPLFEKNEFYIYERKFHNDLPDVLISPISFHLAHSIENFCNFDMKTMMFGLKGTQEILTDPKLNTKIHKDFLENSLNLIFPDRQIRKTENELIENSATKIIKDEILKIVDAKEESEEKESKILSAKSNASYYLRASTLLSSTLNLKKKNSGNLNLSIGGPSANAHGQKKEDKINVKNLKQTIENSFLSIKKIEEGVKHPHKKNVFAKNVFNILPFHQFNGEDFSQVIFPTDPLKELENSRTPNEEFMDVPDKFLLKKEENEEIYEFFKREKLVNTSETKEIGTIVENINKAELYSFEREYSLNFSNPCEVFNRYLIFLDKQNNSADFVPFYHKTFLKKFKRVLNPPMSDLDEFSTSQPVLNKKRERSIILTAVEDSLSEISKKNEINRENGVILEFKKIKLEKPDYTEIELIKDKQMAKRESHEDNFFNEDKEKDYKDADDESDLFGKSDEEKNENDQLKIEDSD